MILVKKGELLNENQRLAVEMPAGPVLVVAGAGTGKTKTLVHRMLYLVERGMSPESILLLTFTRRAANQMLTRATHLLDKRMEKVIGGTFHSFGNSFLRKYAIKLGFSSNFSILDIEDSQLMIGICREEYLKEKELKRFPKKETLQELFSTSFNTNQSLEKIIQKEYPHFGRDIKEIQSIKHSYEKLKKKSNSLDFDDLLHFTRQLLMEDKLVRTQTAERCQSILVDEYQDTNKIQAHIACLIASEHSNIMVVGDDAQSIYGFRGADVRNILDFPLIFPDTKRIILEENYRSEPEILSLANSILSNFKDAYEKNLFTKKKGKKVKPILKKLLSEEKEAEYIAKKIIEENENGTKYKDIVVLSRSGWHTNLLELELNSKNIPYKKYGGRKFLEQAHVKDIISYLRIYQNPLDWLSWNRIVSLEESVGPKQASLFLKQMQNLGDSIFELSLSKLGESFWLGFTQQAKLHLSRLLDFIIVLTTNSEKSCNKIFESTLEYYLPLLKVKYDDYEKRAQDLDSIGLLTNQKSSIEEFISYLSIEATESFVLLPEENLDEEGLVTLSTIHSAKGLEWSLVFIMQLLDGQFPSSKIRTEQELEEERRLFYVAVTRAKTKLILTSPIIQGEKKIQIRTVSRFLSELANAEQLFDSELSDPEIEASIEKIPRKKENSDRFEQIQSYFLN